MLPMFRLARSLSARTWYHKSGYVNALSTIVQKQAFSTSTTGNSKTPKTTSVLKAKRPGQSNEVNISVASVVSKQLDIRGPPRSNKRFPWTQEKDAVLREGIAKHKKDGWEKVTEFVGGGVTALQCKNRARLLEDQTKVGVNRGAWDQEEVRRLEELVPQYLVRSYWSTQLKQMTKEYTDWQGVGKELGRLPSDCSNKWHLVNYEKLKKGRFTAEEDALIRQRVAEWGDKGSGLWVALEKEMGRALGAIQARWNTITSAFQQADINFGMPCQDERLKEGVSLHKHVGWAKVAEYVGGGVTVEQCMSRWSAYVGAMQHGNVKRGAWDQDEVERLAELVPQHLVPSRLSKRTGRMTKQHVEWTKVAAQLGRLPKDCGHKWTSMRTATMKKGPFTDGENAIIRERVEGWGDKGPGLWVGLEKDLGRPLAAIRVQWVNVLSKD